MKQARKERIELLIKVCQAIQHAHPKGIIHRDIKPSNILVTMNDGVPVPKVIDFGIAKATEGRLTDATVYTQLHQFIGTPANMSPEQAELMPHEEMVWMGEFSPDGSRVVTASSDGTARLWDTPGVEGNDLTGLPPGEQPFGDTRFDIRGVVPRSGKLNPMIPCFLGKYA
jgi:serine/threonine protein kinase